MFPRLHAARLVLLLLAGPTAAQAQPWSAPDYVVSRAQIAPGQEEDQVTLLRRVSLRWGSPTLFWVAEQRARTRRFGETRVRHRWIDSRTCPELAATLSAMAALPAVRITGPDAATPPPPFHAPVTTLRGPPDGEGVPITRRDFDGVVSRWWRESERTLERCWGDEPVTLGGQPLTSLLATHTDAAGWRP